MTYTRIYEASQLPSLGNVPEHLLFDMKMEVSQKVIASGDSGALACDIAAFANAAGGVLLVGAKEEPKGVLLAYVPVDHATATKVIELYQDALRLCSPRPVIDPRPIAVPGGYVVAVNCDAYGAPPIGVVREGDNRAEPKWWTYPVRRGNRTHNLRPEELATVMEPKLRRMTLLLESIPVGDIHNRLRPAIVHAGGYFDVAITKIDPAASAFWARQVTLSHNAATAIPLDAIKAIWREQDGRYHIALEGAFIDYGGGSPFVYAP